MGYSWTDYPIDVGTDLIDDVHFQEAETNLNIELDRRGLPPVDLGTLDVVDDMDMTTLRQGIEDAETPSGCSDHYYAFEDAEQSNVQSTYNQPARINVRGTNETAHKYSINTANDEGANNPNYTPFETDGDTTVCSTDNAPVYSDYHHAEYGANYYWDCGTKKTDIDSSNDVNINLNQDATVLDGYRNVHMKSWFSSVNMTFDEAQDFTHCASHYEGNDSSAASTEDGYDYSTHYPVWYFAFCDTNKLNADSGLDTGILLTNCPFHYNSVCPGWCTTVDDPVYAGN